VELWKNLVKVVMIDGKLEIECLHCSEEAVMHSKMSEAMRKKKERKKEMEN
jgi:hypothetical protein